jgi:hypothetical protein
MSSDHEHTLIFESVSGVSIRDAGQTVSTESAASSGLMRAQIEAAAERGIAQTAEEPLG